MFILLLFFSKNFETGKLYTEIVQKRLNEAGITDEEGKPLLEDGIYGEKTKKAHEKAIKIKQFEDENSGVMYGGKSGISENERIKKDIAATTTALSAGDYYEAENLLRTFWHYASPSQLKNEPLALKMLLHSVSSKEPATFTEKDFPDIKNKITADSEFNEALNNFMSEVDPNESNIDNSFHIKFTQDRDLKLAFQKAEIRVKGSKNEDGVWNLGITISDWYNFDELITDQEEYKKDFMAIGANNAAYFSSLLGAIVPYKIEMFFDMEYQQ